MNFKNWYQRNGFLKYQASFAWIIGRLFLSPISRVEWFSKDGNYSEIISNVGTSNREEGIFVASKRKKKKRKKVYSVKSSQCFRPIMVISCPSNFVQNHPMSEYKRRKSHGCGESWPQAAHSSADRPKVQDSSLSVDEERRERWRAAHSLGETTRPFSHVRIRAARLEKAIIQFEDRDRGSRCAGLA